MDSQSMDLKAAQSELEEFRIKTLPASVFYIPNFITPEEEQILLTKVAAVPKPRWKQLSHRRLQAWPSDLTKDILLDSPLPQWLINPILSRMQMLQGPSGHIFSASPHGAPNHVLINEYLPGQGIMPHKDGAAYHEVVATVSLGSPICLDIYGTKDNGTIDDLPRWKILQESRSLLLTSDKLYTDYLHGIAEIKEDVNLDHSTLSNWDLLHSPDDIVGGVLQRGTRISLTYRDVLKVSKFGSKFPILNARR